MAKDPRIGGETVNEILQDLAIRHGVSIEKLKSSEVKKLLDILAEADAAALVKLEKRLARLGPVELQQVGFGRHRTERLIKVREALDEIADRSFEVIHGRLTSTMLDVGKAEAAFQAGAIAATVDLTVDWVTPSNSLLKTLIRARPFDGKLLKEYASEWSAGKKARTTAALRNSIILGEGIPDAMKRVRDVLDNSKIGAERIARTGIAHITNATRAEMYQENADVLKGVKWVATLDTRTCPTCGSLDGKVFPVSSGRRPPAHLSCRCVMTPVTKSTIGKGKKMRVASDGKVPQDVTFAEWLKRQDIETQEDVLGATKAKLFRKGGVKLDGFVDKSGNEFTLDELRRRNAKAFKGARVGEASASIAARRTTGSPVATQPAAKPNIAFRTTKLGIDDAPDPRTIVRYAKTPTAAQKLALAEYKGDDFAAVNEVLRGRRASYDAVEKRIRSLDGALRSSSLKDATTLYRGISDKTLAGIGSDAIGTRFNVKTFQSTSLSKGRATRFAVDGRGRDNPVLLKINAPKGANAIDMDRYGKGYTSQEREVMLPRNATFTIRGISEETGLDQNGALVTLRVVEVDLG